MFITVYGVTGGSAGEFCLESFPLSDMGDKFPYGADKFSIYCIDGSLDKEGGIQTRL